MVRVQTQLLVLVMVLLLAPMGEQLKLLSGLKSRRSQI
jgi:hypothetical protein